MTYLKWVYLVPGVLFAGIADVEKLWVFANISVGVCSLPNLVALLALSGAFFKLMRDYLSDKNEYAAAAVDVTGIYVKSAERTEK